MSRRIYLFTLLIGLSTATAAQERPEDDALEAPRRLSRSSEIISSRDLRIGVGAGTSGDIETSLTVRSRFLGPFSARLGGSLGLTEYAAPWVGAFALGVGIEGTNGPTSTGLWLSAWRQTTDTPVTERGAMTNGTPAPANMVTLDGEVSYRVDAGAGLYLGLRASAGDDRLENSSVTGSARIGMRVHI